MDKYLTPGFSARNVGSIRVLVLVGVPGSGKSTLSETLSNIGSWTVVNQDRMGTREACEKAAARALTAGRNIIVDRCNFDVAQRRTWIHLAQQHGAGANVAAAWLDVNVATCVARVMSRRGHPTLQPGAKSAGIVKRFAGMLKPPHRSEGFACVYRLRNEDESSLHRFVTELCNLSATSAAGSPPSPPFAAAAAAAPPALPATAADAAAAAAGEAAAAAAAAAAAVWSRPQPPPPAAPLPRRAAPRPPTAALLFQRAALLPPAPAQLTSSAAPLLPRSPAPPPPSADVIDVTLSDDASDASGGASDASGGAERCDSACAGGSAGGSTDGGSGHGSADGDGACSGDIGGGGDCDGDSGSGGVGGSATHEEAERGRSVFGEEPAGLIYGPHPNPRPEGAVRTFESHLDAYPERWGAGGGGGGGEHAHKLSDADGLSNAHELTSAHELNSEHEKSDAHELSAAHALSNADGLSAAHALRAVHGLISAHNLCDAHELSSERELSDANKLSNANGLSSADGLSDAHVLSNADALSDAHELSELYRPGNVHDEQSDAHGLSEAEAWLVLLDMFAGVLDVEAMADIFRASAGDLETSVRTAFDGLISQNEYGEDVVSVSSEEEEGLTDAQVQALDQLTAMFPDAGRALVLEVLRGAAFDAARAAQTLLDGGAPDDDFDSASSSSAQNGGGGGSGGGGGAMAIDVAPASFATVARGGGGGGSCGSGGGGGGGIAHSGNISFGYGPAPGAGAPSPVGFGRGASPVRASVGGRFAALATTPPTPAAQPTVAEQVQWLARRYRGLMAEDEIKMLLQASDFDTDAAQATIRAIFPQQCSELDEREDVAAHLNKAFTTAKGTTAAASAKKRRASATKWAAPPAAAHENRPRHSSSAQQRALRGQAAQEFENMRAAFQRASHTYSRMGGGAAAHQIAEGRAARTRMERAGAEAAALALAERNPRLRVSVEARQQERGGRALPCVVVTGWSTAGARGDLSVDLHGLRVAEAQQAVRSIIELRRSQPSSAPAVRLRIITGVGRHSKDAVPRLKPAIGRLLSGLGVGASYDKGTFVVDKL